MTPPAKKYLTTLTPLRGIAALLIVLFHSNLMLRTYIPPGYTKFTATGWLWVDFFFVLSGFIMSYVYRSSFTTTVTISAYKKFLGARFSRIYPLYFLTTLWAFFAVLVIVNKATGFNEFFAAIFNPSALPQCLLLIQSLNLYITPPLNTPSWSLSTEWWVYMVFPLLVPFFTRLNATGRLVMAIAVLGFYLFLRYIIGPIDAPFPNSPPSLNIIAKFGLLRCFAGFLAGMLTHEFYQSKTGFHYLSRSWLFLAFFLATLACLHFGVMDLVTVSFFPFIILTAAYNDSWIKRILDTKILQRLGDWSFSIYMVHVPIIWMFTIPTISKQPKMFESFAPVSSTPDYTFGLLLCLLLVSCTLIIAALSYRFIEVPARNYFNKAFNTKRPQASPEKL